MQEEIKYIRGRVDEVVDTLREQAMVLARNTASLEAHMKRTDQNEKMIQELMRYRYYLMGFTAALVIVTPVIWKLLKLD